MLMHFYKSFYLTQYSELLFCFYTVCCPVHAGTLCFGTSGVILRHQGHDKARQSQTPHASFASLLNLFMQNICNSQGLWLKIKITLVIIVFVHLAIAYRKYFEFFCLMCFHHMFKIDTCFYSSDISIKSK